MRLRRRARGEARAMDWWAADAEPAGGRSINLETATHLGPVFGAIRHIVDFVATLPVKGYRDNGDGTSTPMPSLPLLLRNQDESGMPGVTQFIGQAVFGMLAYGNAVGVVLAADAYGFPTDVRWLRSVDWNYDWVAHQWYLYGQPAAASRVFHIPWLVPPGWVLGMSPIEHYATIIRAGLSAQEYADVRRGGGLPPAVLKNTRLPTLQTPDDRDQAERIREKAVAAFRTGKPFVTGSDWELTAVSIPPNHAQFIETLRLTADQIAAIYGIDSREIGGQAKESLTYSTDESYALKRAGNMRPYVERLEAALARAMPERQFVKFDMDATIRADLKTRTEVQNMKIRNGTLTRNEARAADNLPALPGGDEPLLTIDLRDADQPEPAEPAEPGPSVNGNTPAGMNGAFHG
jgi:HK97 family phage portal protein